MQVYTAILRTLLYIQCTCISSCIVENQDNITYINIYFSLILVLWIYILFLKKNFQIQIRNKEARYLDKLVWVEWIDGYNTTGARDQDTPTSRIQNQWYF